MDLTTRSWVVVTNKDSRGIGKSVQALMYRLVKVACAACGEVTTAGTNIGHEESVAREDHVFDEIA